MAAQSDDVHAPIDDRPSSRSVRRRALLAGIAGATAGAFIRGSQHVAATAGGGNQGVMTLGSNDLFSAPSTFSNTANVSSVSTVIKAAPNFANYANVAGQFVFRADATPTTNDTDINGLEGLASAGGSGVFGRSETGAGVDGVGFVGVSGTSVAPAGGPGLLGQSVAGAGVVGISNTQVGGVFGGLLAAVLLSSQVSAGAPTGGLHSTGELLVDSNGVLFLCKVGGTPGTWVQVSEQVSEQIAGPSFRTLPTPERFIDTRSALGGVQGPVPAGTTSTFQITGRNGESANPALRIPDNATIIVGNLTVIGGANVPVGSFVTLWPSGPRPTTSSISFGPGAIVANGCTVGLTNVAGHGNINVFAQQQCHYIVDIVGFYA